MTWEVALAEIAARLRTLRDADDAAGRPSSFAYYGGGGQGNHSGGAYGASLMKWMRSGRYFNALSQEKTGDFWVNGRMFGSQVVHTAEGMEEADLLIVLGCNPWMAHGFRNARNIVNEFKNDAARKMIVIDPRRTETADAADLHLPVRPGTDAFLLSAILRLLIERGGVDPAFIEAHTDGFEEVASVLMSVPVEEWIAHAEVDPANVDRAVDMILAASAMTVRVELGIQQGRHSTLNSYLEKLLYLLTGHFGRPGTNAVHSWMQPLWSNSRGARSPVTGIEQIGGLYPTNTLAEEILTDHPHRIRALWVESSNPANTAADTARVEEAIRACELSVVVDIAYTETAQLADYILPAAAQHEKWEYTLFNFEFPTNYFHLRRPLFEPLGDALPESEIYARLFAALGVLPDADVLAGLTEVAAHDRPHLLEAAMKVIGDRPELGDIVPVLLYRTLGPSMPHGAAHVAPVWLFCHRAAGTMPEQVRRALGSTADGNALGEELFHVVLDNPSGIAFSTHHYDEGVVAAAHRTHPARGARATRLDRRPRSRHRAGGSRLPLLPACRPTSLVQRQPDHAGARLAQG